MNCQDAIIEKVADFFNVSVLNIKQYNNSPRYSIPRKICWTILNKHLNLPHEGIGILFNNRKRSTITSGINTVLKEMEVDTKLLSKFTEVSKLVAFEISKIDKTRMNAITQKARKNVLVAYSTFHDQKTYGFVSTINPYKKELENMELIRMSCLKHFKESTKSVIDPDVEITILNIIALSVLRG